ncbi:RNA polymerase sigma factor FliA [Candidatus Berkiella aquae]|uniref:RNA polymerase sigma factor FliA n=1 Tax=Candidatus Berkiella aquae TaxID=295108 RepID=A0A0Q9YZ53_9GAMM|nr:RNA polymerase sigma factor FliA [Candidatus Berkiella aquae]MCS5711406.1 RNA polymerase sigma factor FliA [Candidatus Berkiella aquae]
MSGAATYKSVLKESDEDFIKEYAPLVKRIAHHLLARLPAIIQADDLIQAGMIGLIEAARNFDEKKGATFVTYAGIRIRGAMLDEIRKGDWAPRSVHKNSRRVAQAMREVENKTGRDARDTDVAQTLGVSLEEYHQIVQDSNSSKIFAFEDLGVNEEAIDCPTNNPISGPLEGLQRDDFKYKLSKEIEKLPEREKLVLALYYDEELNLREVGEVLGVSESRISQIHSQAMLRLKSRLVNWK